MPRADDVPAAFTSRKLGQVPADFGDGLIVQAIREPELIPLAVRAVRHFGYHGMADIEFKWDARAGVVQAARHQPAAVALDQPAHGVRRQPAVRRVSGRAGTPLDRGAFVQRDFQTRWVSARGLAIHLVRSLSRGPPAATRCAPCSRTAAGPGWGRC